MAERPDARGIVQHKTPETLTQEQGGRLRLAVERQLVRLASLNAKLRDAAPRGRRRYHDGYDAALLDMSRWLRQLPPDEEQ